MTTTYFIRLADADNKTLTLGFGDVKLMSYVATSAQRLLKGMKDTQVNVTVVETENPEADATRTVTSFTGDAGTAGIVLKARVAQERKEQGLTGKADADESTEAPTEDAPATEDATAENPDATEAPTEETPAETTSRRRR
jgi:hypothetical protein